jgi:hypothetical protein
LAHVEVELRGLLQHGAVVGSSGEQEDGGNSASTEQEDGGNSASTEQEDNDSSMRH